MDTIGLGRLFLFMTISATGAVTRWNSLDDEPVGQITNLYIALCFLLGVSMIVACACGVGRYFFKLPPFNESESWLGMYLMFWLLGWLPISAFFSWSADRRFLFLPVGYVALLGAMGLSSVSFHDIWQEDSPAWASASICCLFMVTGIYLAAGASVASRRIRDADIKMR